MLTDIQLKDLLPLKIEVHQPKQLFGGIWTPRTVCFSLLGPYWVPSNSVDFFHCWVDLVTLQQILLFFLPSSFGSPFWGLTIFFPRIWGFLCSTHGWIFLFQKLFQHPHFTCWLHHQRVLTIGGVLPQFLSYRRGRHHKFLSYHRRETITNSFLTTGGEPSRLLKVASWVSWEHYGPLCPAVMPF